MRASIKGDTQQESPIINGKVDRMEQAEIWFDHYKNKLNGTEGKVPHNLDIEELKKLDEDEYIVFSPEVVKIAIKNMNTKCRPTAKKIVHTPHKKCTLKLKVLFLQSPLCLLHA